jgi:Ni/Co efflux regulator RcnB
MKKLAFGLLAITVIGIAVPASAQVGVSFGHRGVQLHLDDHHGRSRGRDSDRFDRHHFSDRGRDRDRHFDRGRGLDRDSRRGRGGSWHFVPH